MWRSIIKKFMKSKDEEKILNANEGKGTDNLEKDN